MLAEKSRRALALSPVPVLAVAGGVAANGEIRAALEQVATRAGARFLAPPLRLCTDNGAMIAALGAQMVDRGREPSRLGLGADSSLPVTTVRC